MASATSRVSAHAAVYKPQPQAASAPASPGGADDASPFSILLGQVTTPKPAQQHTRDSKEDNSGAHTDGAAADTAKNTGSTDDTAASTANPQPAAAAANDDASGDDAVQALPQLPAILLSPGDVAPDKATPGDDKAAVPAGKTKPKSQSDNTVQASATPQPQDAAAQLALVAPVQPPAPAIALPAAAATDGDDDDTQIDAVAPPSKAGPTSQGGAPLTSAPQIDAPAADAPQAGLPQTGTPRPAANGTAPKGAANSAATDSAPDAGDAQADVPAATTPAPAIKPAASKAAAKPAQVQDNVKTAAPYTAANDMPRPQQADATAAAQNAPPAPVPAPVQQTAENTILNAGGLIQPANASAPAAAAPAAAIHIHAAPQDAMTPNMTLLAVQIAAKSQGGARQFDIRLDPPELGRVDVRLSIDASGKAQAHLSADQQGTLDMLQKDSPVLTRALRDAGLDVSQGGLNFSLRGQGGNGAGADGNAGQGTRRGFAMPVSAIKTIDPVAASWRGAADGRLDISV